MERRGIPSPRTRTEKSSFYAMMNQTPNRKIDKLKRFFKGSAKSGTSVQNSSTSGIIPQNQGSAHRVQDGQEFSPRSLWGSAIEKLTPEDKHLCNEFRKPESNIIATLLPVAEAKMEECKNRRWEFDLFGKHLSLRDVVGKIIEHLRKFEQVGDMISSFDPTHFALPWAGGKLLLRFAIDDKEQQSTLLIGLERILYLSCRGCIYEKLYLREDQQSSIAVQANNNLKAALISLYVEILKYLARAIRLFSKGSVARALTAWFTIEEFKSWLQNIQTLESTVAFEASNSGVVLLSEGQSELTSLLESLSEPTSRTDANVLAIHERLDQQEREKILEWISDLPYERFHYIARKGKTTGTGKWLLGHEKYLQWRNSDSSGLLWLHGSPGAGKTKLVTTVVEELLGTTNVVTDGLVYFYCDRNQPTHRDPTSILSSFVRQLSASAGDAALPTCVADVYRSKQSNAFPSGSLTFEESSIILGQLADALSTLTVVLDALDECEQDSRMQLVKLFSEQIARSSKPIKIFMSSRPDRDIKDRLKSEPNLEIDALSNHDDIAKYAKEQIEENCPSSWQRSVGHDLRDRIYQVLLDQCEGMFQWVVLQIRQLFRLSLTRDILERLGRLPRDLDKAYDEIYHMIQNQEGSAPAVAQRAFQWVMCSWRGPDMGGPPANLLLAAVCQDPYSRTIGSVDVDIEYILEACQNLLVYRSELDMFQFAHLSVREYVEMHLATEMQCHALIGQVCLNLLLDPVCRTVDYPMWREEDSADVRVWYNARERARKRKSFLGGVGEPLNSDDSANKAEPSTDNAGQNLMTSRLIIKDVLLEKDNADIWLQEAQARGGSTELSRLWELIRYARVFWTRHMKAAGRSGLSIHPETRDSLQDFFGSFDLSALPLEFWLECPRRKLILSGIPSHRWAEGARCLWPFKTFQGKALFAICMTGLDEVTEEMWSNWPLLSDLRDIEGNTLLQATAATSSLAMARYALKYATAANINMMTGYYGTALQAASVEKNVKGPFYTPALHMAVQNRQAAMVRLLLENGADVNVRGGKHACALEAAVLGGNLEVVALLLQKGADLDVFGSDYQNAFEVAGKASTNSNEMANVLLEYGANPNASGGEYGYPLQFAIRKFNADTVRLLLDNGAHVNACAGYYGYALQAAAHSPGLDTLQLLIDSGADVNAHGGHFGHALQAAADKGNIGGMRLLLRHGAKVDARGGHHGCALQAAISKKSIEMVELLLNHNADVNAGGGEYGFALHTASHFGCTDIARLLLNHGADINACGGKLGYALHAALTADMMDLLLDHGADINAHYGSKGTALHAAARAGSFEPIEHLLERGADINAWSDDYGSALHRAVRSSRVSAAECLLERGINVNAKGGRHGTCLNLVNNSNAKKTLTRRRLISLLRDEYGGVDEPNPASEEGGTEN